MSSYQPSDFSVATWKWRSRTATPKRAGFARPEVLIFDLDLNGTPRVFIFWSRLQPSHSMSESLAKPHRQRKSWYRNYWAPHFIHPTQAYWPLDSLSKVKKVGGSWLEMDTWWTPDRHLMDTWWTTWWIPEPSLRNRTSNRPPRFPTCFFFKWRNEWRSCVPLRLAQRVGSEMKWPRSPRMSCRKHQFNCSVKPSCLCRSNFKLLGSTAYLFTAYLFSSLSKRIQKPLSFFSRERLSEGFF